MGLGGQGRAPAALPPGKTLYPLYRRLGGSQGRSGRVRKTSPLSLWYITFSTLKIVPLATIKCVNFVNSVIYFGHY